MDIIKTKNFTKDKRMKRLGTDRRIYLQNTYLIKELC